jgi:hypothetical protein
MTEARAVGSGNLEVRSVLVLSTCHVTHADMTQIEERRLARDCPIVCADDNYGAWLYAPGDEAGLADVNRFGFSDSMVKVMRFARDRGIEYVRLDCDGDQLESQELDRHDW